MEKNIFDAIDKNMDEVSNVSQYDVDALFSDTDSLLSDLGTVADVSANLLTTENSEMIRYQLSRVNIDLDEATLTTESALEGRDNFFDKVADLGKKIKNQSDSNIGLFGGMWRKMVGKSVAKLTEAKEKIKDGTLVPVVSIDSSDMKTLNSKMGLLNALDIKPDAKGIIQLIEMPFKFAKEIYPENQKFLEVMYQDVVAKPDNILKAIKNKNLPEAKESVKLLKSIKGIEFKKGSEVHAGLPLKVFTKSVSFVSVITLEDKLMIEIDTVPERNVDIKPLSSDDMVKIIDAAITEINNNAKVVDELSKSMKALLPKWADSTSMSKAVAKDGSSLGIMTNISRIHRYIGYFLDGSRNISYDFYEINKFTNKLVDSSFNKKN